jgi:hypothetical protein
MAGSEWEKASVAAAVVAVGPYAELDEDGVIEDEEVLLSTLCCWCFCWSANGVNKHGQPFSQGEWEIGDVDDGENNNEGESTMTVALGVGKQGDGGDEDDKAKGKGKSTEDLEPDLAHECSCRCCMDGTRCCWSASCD